MEKVKKVTLSFRIPVETKKQLQEEAKFMNCSLSFLVAKIIEDYLDQKEY